MSKYPMEAAKTIDLKKTVHLPRTDFPMKANLGQLEPKTARAMGRNQAV